MKAYRLIVALCSFLLIAGATSGQNSHDLVGTWHTQSNATLTITAISSAGRFTGTYLVHTGPSAQKFPLFGWVNPVGPLPKKDHIVPVIFTVQWAVCGNVTVWAGYLSKDRTRGLSITTIWNVVRANLDPDSPLIQDAVNETTFKPGPAKWNKAPAACHGKTQGT